MKTIQSILVITLFALTSIADEPVRSLRQSDTQKPTINGPVDAAAALHQVGEAAKAVGKEDPEGVKRASAPAEEFVAVAPPTTKPVEEMTDEEYKAYIKLLPPDIQKFIELYTKYRPDMRFHPILFEVAQQRARNTRMGSVGGSKYSLMSRGPQSGPTAPINGMVRKAGYALPSNMSNERNGVESFYTGANNQEAAFEAWMRAVGNRKQLLGQESFGNHKYFGIGHYPVTGPMSSWSFISAPEQVKEKK